LHFSHGEAEQPGLVEALSQHGIIAVLIASLKVHEVASNEPHWVQTVIT
jgi:hypothetical protein